MKTLIFKNSITVFLILKYYIYRKLSNKEIKNSKCIHYKIYKKKLANFTKK